MMTKTEEKVEQLKAVIQGGDTLDIKRMNFRLSDAIREGASITVKADGWGDGDSACALHGAIISAKARGYIE